MFNQAKLRNWTSADFIHPPLALPMAAECGKESCPVEKKAG